MATQLPGFGAQILVIAAACLLGGAAAAVDSADKPAVAAKKLLAAKDFPFCKPDYALRWGDGRWCRIGADMAACPGFATACVAAKSGDAATRGAAGMAKHLQGEKGRGAAKRSASPDDDAEAPAAFGGLLRDLLVGAAIALVLWIVWQMWRNRTPTPVAADSGQTPADIGELELPNAGALPTVAFALQRAEALAGTQPGLALAWLYAAAMRWLHDAGHLQWRPYTSNRAVLRAALAVPALRALLRGLVATLERWRFGGVQPTPAEAQDAVQRLASALRVGVAVAAVAVFAGCSLAGDSATSGRALAWELLRAQGFTVGAGTQALSDVDAKSDALWIDVEDATIHASMLRELRSAVCRGGRIALLVANPQSLAGLVPLEVTETVVDRLTPAPTPADAALPTVVLPLHRSLVVSDAAVAESTTATAPPTPVEPADPDEKKPAPDQAATDAAAAADCEADGDPTVLATVGGRPFAMRCPLGKGELIVVADNDIVANAALAVPSNADLLVALARATTGNDHALSLFVPQRPAAADPAQTLTNAGLWPLTGQGALALLVLAVAMGRRFGRPRDDDRVPRRNYAEHIDAVGFQLLRRRAMRWPAAAYATWALERLRTRAGRGLRPTDLPALTARLQLAQTAVAAPVVAETLREAEALRQRPLGADDPGQLETIAALDRLLGGLDRAHRNSTNTRK